jgi:hypothetical protein
VARAAVALASVGLLVGCRGDQPAEASAPAVELVDLSGRSVDPFESLAPGATVFLFTRTDCPVSNRYAPEIRRLHERYAERGVAFWLVYPNPDVTAEAIRAHIAEYEYPLPALRDAQHRLVHLTEATITPEAAVYSADGRLVYRGRIDDRYVDFGKTRARATRHDLEDAIEATLSGRPVPNPRTEAVGCFIADLR